MILILRGNCCSLLFHQVEDLAWGGLHGTVPYENNNPTTRLLTDDDRNRVQLVGQAESSNLPQQQYSIMGVLITTHNPHGIPCN